MKKKRKYWNTSRSR